MNMIVLGHSNLHITSIHIPFSLMRSVPRSFELEATFSLGALHPSPSLFCPLFPDLSLSRIYNQKSTRFRGGQRLKDILQNSYLFSSDMLHEFKACPCAYMFPTHGYNIQNINSKSSNGSPSSSLRRWNGGEWRWGGGMMPLRCLLISRQSWLSLGFQTTSVVVGAGPDMKYMIS